MKKIEAIIRPSRLEAVRTALARIGISGMTISEVKGAGREPGQAEFYRGREYDLQFIPKLKIEVIVDAKQVNEAVEQICMAARTGNIGDGKLMVYDLEHFVRIRTGESGKAAT
jgi:nitrogen regulatory protein PII